MMDVDENDSRKSEGSKEAGEEIDTYNAFDDDDDEDLDEEEINEELALPQVLSSLSIPEKKELLRFKRAHNEREWEEEVMNRQESIGRKMDFERLKRMKTGGKQEQTKPLNKPLRRAATKTVVFDPDSGDEEDAFETNTAKKKAPRKKEVKPKDRPASKGKRKVEQDEDEDEDFAAPQAEEEDEDDLFDSDEEEKWSKKYRSAPVADEADEDDEDDAPKSRKTKTLRKRGRSMKVAAGSKARKRSRLDDLDDDDDMEEGEVEDEDDEDDEDNGLDDDEKYQEDGDIGRIKKTFKPAGRDGSNVRKSERSSNNASKEIVLNSLDDYKRMLLQEHASAGGDKDMDELDIKTEEDDEPATYQDLLRIFLRREDLAKMMHEPYFEKYVTGCYVRFMIDSKPGELAVYRCCEIVGVQYTEKSYKIETLHGPVETKMTLSLNSCGATKERRRIERVSNHTITEHEATYHINGSRNRGIVVTKWDVKKKRRQMKGLAGGYIYSNEEIDTMIKAKTGMNNVFQTDHTSALEELKQKKEKVRKQVPVDYELLDLVNREIEKLEQGIEHDKNVFDKAYKLKAEINQRMRTQNTKRDMEAGMRQRQEEREAIAKGKQPNAITDPFVRRETRPKILFQTTSQIKAKEEEKKAADAAKAAGEVVKPAEKAAASVARQGRTRIDDDDWAIPLVVDMDQIRKRFKARHNIDPLENIHLSPAERYLKMVTKGLPPLGSAEREAMRGNTKSFTEYMRTLRSTEGL